MFERNPLVVRGQYRDWPSQPMRGGSWMMGRHQEFDLDDEDDSSEIEFMLGRIEREVDVVDGEVDMLDEDGDAAMLGAVGGAVAKKIARLEKKLTRVEDRLADLPPHRTRRRRKLAKKIDRIQEKLEDARAKLSHKLTRAVGKGRLHPAAAAGIAAAAGASVGAMTMLAPASGPGTPPPASGSAVQAYSHLDYPVQPFTGRVAPTQVVNEVRRAPSAGEEIRLPFELTGSSIVRITFAANPFPAAPVQTATVVVITPLIPYAAFQCTSFDSSLAVLPNSQAFVTAVASFVGVAGDKNLLYATEPLEFAGQFVGQSSGRTIAGLRENQIIQPVNTVSATITVQQEVNNDTPIEIVLKTGIVVRSIWDNAVRR